MDSKIINKKAQISIFVIVGMLIVAVIIIFFLIYRGPKISIGEEFNPESFIDKCLRDSVRDKVDIMLPQGGFVNPSDFKVYNNIKIAYLCKNVNYYEPCITQHPLYITQIENELTSNIQEEVEQCFILLEEGLDKRNYEHSGGEVTIESTLKPGLIEVTVFRNFTISKSGSVRDFDSFGILLNAPLYDLAYIANEIASQEAKYCYFEYLGFSLLYNNFDIQKNTMSDSTKIYTIKDKASGREMNIAVRGCAVPAGF